MVKQPAPEKNGDKLVVEVDPELKDLVPDFLSRKRNDVYALVSALERRDFEVLRSIGHRIKGEGGGFGFDTLTEIGAALEEAAKAKEVDAAQRQVSALSEYLERIQVVFPEHSANGHA